MQTNVTVFSSRITHCDPPPQGSVGSYRVCVWFSLNTIFTSYFLNAEQRSVFVAYLTLLHTYCLINLSFVL